MGMKKSMVAWRMGGGASSTRCGLTEGAGEPKFRAGGRTPLTGAWAGKGDAEKGAVGPR